MARGAPEPDTTEEYAPSAVNLRKSDWKFLRRVAEAHADKNGGRPSVSKVIERLIDENRRALKATLPKTRDSE